MRCAPSTARTTLRLRHATEGAFRFSNPKAGWLVVFERVLFRFARQIVSAAKVDRFEHQLRCWAEYRDMLLEEDPNAK